MKIDLYTKGILTVIAYAISASEILEKGNVVHTFRNQNDGTMFAWVAYKKSYICILDVHRGVLTDDTNVTCFPIEDRGVGEQID